MDKRKLKLAKYGISGKRYKELCGFCEQYPEWKHYLDSEHGEPQSPIMTDMPKSPNSNPDKILNLASRRIEYEEKVALIEETAKEADPVYWKSIIDSVCYEVPLTYLQTMKDTYVSQNTFYVNRRYFFYLLDKKKR